MTNELTYHVTKSINYGHENFYYTGPWCAGGGGGGVGGIEKEKER